MTDDRTTVTGPTSMDEASGETSTGTGGSTDPAGSTGTAGDPYAWTEPEAGPDRGAQAREWLTQLQAMIENLATQAAPVIREIGAKAAELTAVAGEKAGPVAQRTAEVTGEAGHKLAERARSLAAELRRDQAAAGAATSEGTNEPADTGVTAAPGVPGDSPDDATTTS
jgi:hypothetical protein